MRNNFNKTELNNLRKALPPGSIELISWKTGLAESSVKQILYKPERCNPNIIKMAVSIAEKHKEQFEILKNKIKAISA